MKLSGLGYQDVEQLNEQQLLDGFLDVRKYTLRYKRFDGGLSEPLEREGFFRPPSVGVILYDPAVNKLVLVEQFRMGPYLSKDDPWLLEIVAGMTEPGENAAEVAHREIKEETGQTVRQLIHIFDVYLSPGCSNEKMTLYCGLVDAGDGGGVFGLEEEGEDIKVHTLLLEEACQMLEDGRIANSPAVIAIQWLKLHQGELMDYV